MAFDSVRGDRLGAGNGKAAEQAKTYLRRIINEHAGTPWAALAQQELGAELGWAWTEFSQPIPGSDQLRASDEVVEQLLKADRAQRRRAEQPRERPKL